MSREGLPIAGNFQVAVLWVEVKSALLVSTLRIWMFVELYTLEISPPSCHALPSLVISRRLPVLEDCQRLQ